jgi:hypothetical protein
MQGFIRRDAATPLSDAELSWWQAEARALRQELAKLDKPVLDLVWPPMEAAAGAGAGEGGGAAAAGGQA